MKDSKKPNLVVAGILDFLEERGEQRLLPEVTRQLESLLEEAKEAEAIEVKSFIALSKTEMEELKNSLRKFLGNKLPMVNGIDKKLLGGFTIKVGDWFLDASLASDLTFLRQLLIS